ncbi:zinc-dependent alcohol dehydrogenase family protein [Chlamydiota bacterium]
MRAMVLRGAKSPLQLTELPIPQPSAEQVLIKVVTCGVCRTDLHIVDGELPLPKLPLVPGHQIVGHIVQLGANVKAFQIGDRVGVPWLGSTCGKCSYCLNGQENLCDNALYTGYQIDGGFAEYCVADARFIFPLSPSYTDLEAAPLLCAGLIGYRALRLAGDAPRIGFYGFGASANLLTQIVLYRGAEVYAFTKPGDTAKQAVARQLGAVWASGTDTLPPYPLDAAIIFAPAGPLVPLALKAVKKGGTVVCAGIHMSEIPSFSYDLLWGERILRSVANLTRQDGHEFLALAPQIPIKTEVHTYPLEGLNQALDDLRHGRFSGTAVIQL